MPPESPSSSSICCCTRYFRRSPPAPKIERDHIEIKVNGEPHLTVPHVAIRPANSAPGSLETRAHPDTISVSEVDIFETARTSRSNGDGRLIPMNELMRMIRIEEGLEVTPRPVEEIEIVSPNLRQNPNNPIVSQMGIPIPKPRRAVFNEEGDITSRSSTSKVVHNPVPRLSITSQRRISVISLDVPVVVIPSTIATTTSSPMPRRISASPQMITALVAFTYACLTTMITTFTNLFSRSVSVMSPSSSIFSFPFQIPFKSKFNFICSLYVVLFAAILSIFSVFLIKITHEIHSIQKLVSVEMIVFSYASNEAWNELNKIRRKRSVSRKMSGYFAGPANNNNQNRYQNSDNYEVPRPLFPDPMASVDGFSKASVNGEGVRNRVNMVKSQRKEERRKTANGVCLKDCVQKSKGCPPGPPGPPGRTGIPGEPGVAGIDGVEGCSGIGVAVAGGCIKCPQGRPGGRGKRGPRGEPGRNGKEGISVRAVVGLPGPVGPQGDPGYPGFLGEQGPAGPPGGNTNQIRNTRGPPGPPGRQGYQGAQGPAGFVYNTAILGPIGLPGRPGKNGKPGANGLRGPVGRAGRDGNYCQCPQMSRQNPSWTSSKYLIE